MNVLERISCHNFIIANGYAYFSNWFYNAMFKVEIATGKTTFLGIFEDEGIFERNIHCELFLRDEKIYFCPGRRGRHVHIYNLVNQSMQWVEIRKNYDLLAISEVVLGDKNVFFVPQQKHSLIKKLDLESLEVIEIKEETEIKGKSLLQSKETFPFWELLNELHIEYSDRFFWRQTSDKSWYGFIPMGRKMLRCKEESGKIEMISLDVVNRTQLGRYLYKVNEELKKTVISERGIRLQELLYKIKILNKHDSRGFENRVGEIIWRNLIQ